MRNAVKFDFFVDTARKCKIEALGDPLQRIAHHIDFEHLTQTLPRLQAQHQRGRTEQIHLQHRHGHSKKHDSTHFDEVPGEHIQRKAKSG